MRLSLMNARPSRTCYGKPTANFAEDTSPPDRGDGPCHGLEDEEVVSLLPIVPNKIVDNYSTGYVFLTANV